MLDPLAGPLVAQFSYSVVRRLQLFSHGFPTTDFFLFLEVVFHFLQVATALLVAGSTLTFWIP